MQKMRKDVKTYFDKVLADQWIEEDNNMSRKVKKRGQLDWLLLYSHYSGLPKESSKIYAKHKPSWAILGPKVR